MVDETIEIKIEGDTSGINNALDKTNKKLTTSEQKAAEMSQRMKELKVVGIAALTGIGAAAVKSVKEFAKFDDQMRGVKTLLDESSFGAKGLEQGFKDMTNQVKVLGRKVPVDIGAMNKALFDTISAGVDAGDAVGVLEASAKLAVAGLTDVSVATDGMTSALNAYALGAEDADEVASKFFLAQKKGKTTIAELSSGFGLVGASANAFGVSLDEVLASVSAVTTAGVQTNSAYTGLNAVLANIAKPTAEAAIEARRLGIEFNSTALRSKGLKGFLDALTSSAGFSNTSIEKLFGSVQAQKIAFALTGQQASAFSDTLIALSEKQESLNTLSAAYGVQADGIKSKMDIVTNKVQLMAIAFGEALAPTILSAVGSLDALGRAFSKITSNKAPQETFGTINRRLREIKETIAELKKGTGDLNIYGMPTNAAVGRLKEVAKLERTLLVLNTRKQALIADADEAAAAEKTLQAKKDQIAKEEALRAAASLKKLADQQTLAEETALNSQALFDAQLATTKENAEILSNEELIALNSKLVGRQEATDIAAAVELQKQGKHDQALAKLQGIKAKKDKAATKASLDLQVAYTNTSLSLANNLANLSIAISGKQSKAIFLIQKAAAIAQAIVATQSAAAQALAVFPAPNFVLAGLAKAAGYVNVATIAATAIQGFDNGGIVGGNKTFGDRNVVRANSKEAVLTTGDQAELLAIARGNGSSGGSEIVLSLKDGLVDFIEAQINERRATGISTI